MKLVGATVYALGIPFVEAFKHSTKERTFSDAVVVRLVDDEGREGYGEGLPRPYVTGETVESTLSHLARMWDAVAGRQLPVLAGAADLDALDAFIPELEAPGVVAANAARAAFEVALVDLLLKAEGRSLQTVLPPARPKVTYSGVITAGSPEKAAQHARQMKLVGLGAVKVKVGLPDDEARVAAVREVFGPSLSLRLDANGAWSPDEAVAALDRLAVYGIDAVEQPIGRGEAATLAALRRRTTVPIMVDESLITRADAVALIEASAVDYFNIRVSKCGGLGRTLAIARLAQAAGIRLQVGSQVGETAILSAAGRHLAAHLEGVDFVEGSFGTLLLTEDVSLEPVRFGHKGEAPVLAGPGLGVRVAPDRLAKYARQTVRLGAAVPS